MLLKKYFLVHSLSALCVSYNKLEEKCSNAMMIIMSQDKHVGTKEPLIQQQPNSN